VVAAKSIDSYQPPLYISTHAPVPVVVDIRGLRPVNAGYNQVVTLAAATPTPVATGLENPTGVAVDRSGNLHIRHR
jgi:hypothetical protein